MNKISFCINTTKFELDFLKLLFYSLSINLHNRSHEILVFVENDTDNKDVQSFLLSQKYIFPNLRLIINPLPICIGYANNINILFSKATHEIVSYLQSDMLIGPSYDAEVLMSLKKLGENTVLSSTRIEPSLHPESPEKITKDFGLYPNEILSNFDAFCEFSKSQKNYDKITSFFFAPFTLHKNLWNSIGGHDTLFRRSREDSDILYRMTMNGYNIQQCWNAIVYHRSCVSSRGKDFFTNSGQSRSQLQQTADMVEMHRFLRKWPKFKHDTIFDPETEYKYHISVNFTNAIPRDYELLGHYHLFHRIYIDNEETRSELKKLYEQLHIPANKLLNISPMQWEIYGKYYRQWKFSDMFVNSPITDDDIILNITLNNRSFREIYSSNEFFFKHLNQFIHSNKNEEPGTFEIENVGQLTVNCFNNRIQDNLIVNNPPLDFDLITI